MEKIQNIENQFIYKTESLINKGDYRYELITTQTKQLKPIYNENGERKYKDVLIYLARVLPPDEINLEFIFTLASYAINKQGIKPRQKKFADKIINYYTERGIL